MISVKQLFYLARRIIKQNLTNADTVITVIAMPVFMLLFFVYVLGGNISLESGKTSIEQYLNYSLPGFLLISMASGSAYTAMRINLDKTKGFLNRLHSLPIKRWIILWSHVLASVVFMLLAELAVFIVALIMGYRPQANLNEFLLFVVLSIAFSLAITLLAIPFSLKAKDYASAGGFSYILLMMLFVSSALMPTKGMVGPIRFFAEHQPITPIVNTARSMLNGTLKMSNNVQLTIIWLIGLILVFGFLALRRYHKTFE